jgi:hypothetical protein
MNCIELNIKPCGFCRLSKRQYDEGSILCWITWFIREFKNKDKKNLIEWMNYADDKSYNAIHLEEALKHHPELYDVYQKLLALK